MRGVWDTASLLAELDPACALIGHSLKSPVITIKLFCQSCLEEADSSQQPVCRYRQSEFQVNVIGKASVSLSANHRQAVIGQAELLNRQQRHHCDKADKGEQRRVLSYSFFRQNKVTMKMYWMWQGNGQAGHLKREKKDIKACLSRMSKM